MLIRPCILEDYNHIITNFLEFWDNDTPLSRHHVLFIREFGNTAYVAEINNRIAGYLLGFFAQSGPYAYSHMLAVHQNFRRQGVARELYHNFIKDALAHGCTELRATAAPYNKSTIAFHTAFGMTMHGEPDHENIPIIPNYGGPGIDRVLFTMPLTSITQ